MPSTSQHRNLHFVNRANHVARRIKSDGIITTVVGCSSPDIAPDDEVVMAARIDMPNRLIIAPNGMLYFADSRDNEARQVSGDGRLETVAGEKVAGDRGGGELAALAMLSGPYGLSW